MFRFLLVTCERGTLVANPHIDARRYLGKPNPGPVWKDGEEPRPEVAKDDPALRKAHKNPGDKFTILAECVAQDIVVARAQLQPAPVAAPSVPRTPKKGGE